jgi:hypothetical protein
LKQLLAAALILLWVAVGLQLLLAEKRMDQGEKYDSERRGLFPTRNEIQRGTKHRMGSDLDTVSRHRRLLWTWIAFPFIAVLTFSAFNFATR